MEGWGGGSWTGWETKYLTDVVFDNKIHLPKEVIQFFKWHFMKDLQYVTIAELVIASC